MLKRKREHTAKFVDMGLSEAIDKLSEGALIRQSRGHTFRQAMDVVVKQAIRWQRAQDRKKKQAA